MRLQGLVRLCPFVRFEKINLVSCSFQRRVSRRLQPPPRAPACEAPCAPPARGNASKCQGVCRWQVRENQARQGLWVVLTSTPRPAPPGEISAPRPALPSEISARRPRASPGVTSRAVGDPGHPPDLLCPGLNRGNSWHARESRSGAARSARVVSRARLRAYARHASAHTRAVPAQRCGTR